MKKKLIDILLLSICMTCVATHEYPASPTKPEPKTQLTKTEEEIIRKIKLQVKEYTNYRRENTLNTLGNYLRKEVLQHLKELLSSFNKEMTKSTKTDLGTYLHAGPRQVLAVLINFFNAARSELQPLMTIHTSHSKKNIATKTKKNQGGTTAGLSDNEEKEFYQLEQHVLLPLRECQDVVDTIKDKSLLLVLDYIN